MFESHHQLQYKRAPMAPFCIGAANLGRRTPSPRSEGPVCAEKTLVLWKHRRKFVFRVTSPAPKRKGGLQNPPFLFADRPTHEEHTQIRRICNVCGLIIWGKYIRCRKPVFRVTSRTTHEEHRPQKSVAASHHVFLERRGRRPLQES